MGEREDLDLRREQEVEGLQVESSFSVVACDGNILHSRSRPFRDYLPGNQIGVVFHFCQENHIASFEMSGAPALSYEVDRFGGAPCEDDLRRMAGIQKRGDAGSSCFVSVGGPHRERVKTSVDIGVVVLVVASQRVDHYAWLVGCGGIVQINERPSANHLMERGKVRANIATGEHETTSQPACRTPVTQEFLALGRVRRVG